MANLQSILNNIKEIAMTDSSLATLIDYERVLDQLDLYSFKNWQLGELVSGPIYEKYFITCSWMYPFRQMPDPSGAERLLGYGCEVNFKKDFYEYPKKVESPDDFQPGTKYPRMVKKPVWVVTITMPKKLMGDIEKGSLELENEIIDAEDIETAYEENVDDVQQQKNNQMAQPAMGMPGMTPPMGAQSVPPM
jgi:hypothetical protein